MFSFKFGRADKENCKMNANKVIRLSSLWRLKFPVPGPQCARTAFCKRHPRVANQLASYFHTSSYNRFADEDSKLKTGGFLSSLKNYFKWAYVDKQKVFVSAISLYEGCTDKIDLKFFLHKLQLPDTFYSWFLLTELHVWMCSVRAVSDGDEGMFLRDRIIEAMWRDVEVRISKMKNVGGKKKDHIKHLNQHFQGAMVAYSEGLMGNDELLATALWRNLFSCKCENPEHLETMVQYVRMQVSNLDLQSKKEFLFIGKTNWLPFKDLDHLS